MSWKKNPGTVPGVAGSGKFKALEEKLATEPGVRSPGGLAAAIGRRIAAKGGR